MADDSNVRLQLNDLEAEEAQIMRELREMDERAQAETEENRQRAERFKEDPQAALASQLLECEKEVRDAKGYIADQGPPLKIVRLRFGETGPKNATYLSRPRNTGVDFTVPVTLKAYTDLIKNPIFLNQIRDKIKAQKYTSTEDYLDDMRLLVRNTAQFNKGPELAWVVQHARFLLQAAEDAITSRRRLFYEVEEALRQSSTSKPRVNPTPTAGKRKRPSAADKTNGDVSAVPAVGSAIEIYWPSYRKWYLAYITDRSAGAEVHVRYDEDNSEQWVNLDQERWRMRNSRTGAGRAKRAHEPASKRRKSASGAAASQQSDQPVIVSGGVTPEDLDAIKIDLFAKMEDLRDSVTDSLKEHMHRIDRIMMRSDALSRILVQMQDLQSSVDAKVEAMGEKIEQTAVKVEQALQKMETQISTEGIKTGEKKDLKADPEPDDESKEAKDATENKSDSEDESSDEEDEGENNDEKEDADEKEGEGEGQKEDEGIRQEPPPDEKGKKLDEKDGGEENKAVTPVAEAEDAVEADIEPKSVDKENPVIPPSKEADKNSEPDELKISEKKDADEDVDVEMKDTEVEVETEKDVEEEKEETKGKPEKKTPLKKREERNTPVERAVVADDAVEPPDDPASSRKVDGEDGDVDGDVKKEQPAEESESSEEPGRSDDSSSGSAKEGSKAGKTVLQSSKREEITDSTRPKSPEGEDAKDDGEAKKDSAKKNDEGEKE